MGKPRARGRRGLDKGELLEAAFSLLARVGEGAFSLRKLGAEIGVDPMTILHHFQSKDDLFRAIADRALASIDFPKPSGDWKRDLRRVAEAYRNLAHRYPKIFHLHFRFHATGPLDHASSEVVYRAILSTGLKKSEAAGLGLAFYAFVLGFSLAEAEGLLAPLKSQEERELLALDASAFPATRALVGAFKGLKPDLAFDAAIDAFIEGVAQRCAAANDTVRAPSRARGRMRVVAR